MKLIKKIFACAVVAIAAMSVTPQAQGAGFRFGVKAGVAINELKFNKDAFHSNNRAGFTGGIMGQFTVPIIGVGADLSVLYVRRSTTAYANVDPALANTLPGVSSVTETKLNRDYIDIPLNFKWCINIPAVSNIISPFITTGPDFSFLLSKQNVENAWNQKKFDFAWNVGFGLQLVNKVQLAASYGFGLTKSASGDNALYDTGINGKNRFWTVTAAYLF